MKTRAASFSWPPATKEYGINGYGRPMPPSSSGMIFGVMKMSNSWLLTFLDVDLNKLPMIGKSLRTGYR